MVKKLEENLEEISIEQNNSEDFTRPELLFKSDNSIYKGSWKNYWNKEGYDIFIDSKGK